MSAANRVPRIAATRSLSTTASIPSQPRRGCRYTGEPPPPAEITILPSSTRCRTAGHSTMSMGIGLGASRRHRPEPSRPTGTPTVRKRSTSSSRSACPMGFVGSSAASPSAITVCVIVVRTSRATPARLRAFCKLCCTMYPIQPAVPETSIPSGNGSTRPRATSLRSRSSPTCGPFPCTTAMRHPSRASVTTTSSDSRVWRNWSKMVTRSPGGCSAFPPRATTIVPGVGASRVKLVPPRRPSNPRTAHRIVQTEGCP